MPTVPEAHMCSVRALSAVGRMPSASAAIEAMWLWNAVRSGMTEPTTSPSRSRGFTPGIESKHAFPASQIRSRYEALRTPNFVTPAPTIATLFIARLGRRGPEHARAVPGEVAGDHQAQDLGGAAAGEQEAGVAEVALDRIFHGQDVGGQDAGGFVGDADRGI